MSVLNFLLINRDNEKSVRHEIIRDRVFSAGSPVSLWEHRRQDDKDMVIMCNLHQARRVAGRQACVRTNGRGPQW